MDSESETSENAGPARGAVLEAARQVLADGQPRKAKEIAAALVAQGLAGVDRSLVSSILSREGQGAFAYDRTTYTYTLGSGAEPGEPGTASTAAAPPAAATGGSAIPRAAVLAGARAVLRDGEPRLAREIAAALAQRGLPGVDKSLVNSVLSREGKDLFAYDRTTYTYTLAAPSGANSP